MGPSLTAVVPVDATGRRYGSCVRDLTCLQALRPAPVVLLFAARIASIRRCGRGMQGTSLWLLRGVPGRPPDVVVVICDPQATAVINGKRKGKSSSYQPPQNGWRHGGQIRTV